MLLNFLPFFFSVLFPVVTVSLCIAAFDLQQLILLPHLPKSWDYSGVTSPSPSFVLNFNC
jgi:hypothetical protein